MRRPRWPAQGKRSMLGGSSVSTRRSLSTLPCTSLPLPGCSSTSSAWGWLPSVADNPQTISSGIHWRSRASASCSCAPRLLPSSSCHSSTTSMRSPAKAWRASARVSSRVRLSGVVTSALGNRRPWRARSAPLVSPVRRPMLQLMPSSSSGACRARAVSAASARIGVIQSTVKGAGLSVAVEDGALVAKRFSAPSQTA